MKPKDNIEKLVRRLRYKARTETHNRVLGDIMKIFAESNTTKAAESQPNLRGNIMKSRITKFAAAAVIIIGVIIGISQLGTPFDASQVFANAIDSITQARTFSCMEIEERIVDGQENVEERLIMFKEPDFERI